ncbi:MAG: type III-A CRISPR-associated protein Csm2 [bacterium]
MMKLSDLKDNSKLVELADSNDKIIKNKGIKANQLRNILEFLIKIKLEYKTDLINQNQKDAENKLKQKLQLLRIRLAYAKGKKSEMQFVKDLIEPLINDVDTYEDFEKLYKFFEGIISYHKYYGGGK